VSKIVK